HDVRAAGSAGAGGDLVGGEPLSERTSPVMAHPSPADDEVVGGRASAYKPIAAYGVIGDMRTCALVGLDGSIDWCCLPRFDSSSVFGAVLDAERGGRFHIAPTAAYEAEQRYLDSTNVLVTAFRTETGTVELTDFMPTPEAPTGRRVHHEVHRRIACTEGRVEVEIRFEPRFDYGQAATELIARRHGVLATDQDAEAVALSTVENVWWRIERDRPAAHAALTVEAGDEFWTVLRYDDDEVRPIERYESDRKLEATTSYWRDWADGITYDGPYRAQVERSALALKLLSYAPTGAFVAAPTTSLPEEIGGVRNWDYRYTWLRDAAFTIYALHVIGHYEEADRFMNYLKRVTRKSMDHLQVMFGIGGERDLTERTLDHLEGYRGSRPVRVGNGAYDQLQLDVYGEVMEAAFLWHHNNRMTEGLWSLLARLADWVAANWRTPDSSLWEVRAERRHYVFSKVMCWVALDRAVEMAEQLELPGDVEGWRTQRDDIHADVLEHGWNEEKRAFVQHYDTDALDAANLLIPLVRFLPRDDPRVRSTIEATVRELTNADYELVYRYRNPDGLPGSEGVFSICTFWLADALLVTGDVEHGERIFRRMLGHANHVGLYSEELNAATGEFLGNFPQAFTHIALINTAQILEWAHGRA
ncbi:MAG: glycoside hydrolase family 15 protein, partial [Gemmatimonadota bacterium]